MTHNSFLRFGACGILFVCAAVVVAAVTLDVAGNAGATGAGDTNRIHWKPVIAGQVKLDGKIPLKSGAYLPTGKEKKHDFGSVLILLGHRYMAIDTKARVIYFVLPTELQAEGEDFESDDFVKADRVIPSSDWSLRDVGPAELIQLTLQDYGGVLEVELPHPPDLRRGFR
jgi:hypothetical protein